MWTERRSLVAEKLIGSLIYGEHEVPKKQRPWQQRIKLPLLVGVVFLLAGGAAYKFANYREERSVRQFLEAVQGGQYDVAYKSWDAEGGYSMNQFLQDWGARGYYTSRLGAAAKVADSHSKGSVVIVSVSLDSSKFPLRLRVDKETMKLSFSP
jgi:hypothetical protein